MTRTNLKDDYTITEALMLVRDAALRGEKLEAWCEEDPGQFYSYNTTLEVFDCILEFHNLGHPIHDVMAQFSTRQALGTWHVREVKDE